MSSNPQKMREKYFKSDTVEMWLENGIIYVIHAENVTVTLEIAEMNVKKRLELYGGQTYPMFVDGRKGKTVSREARQYLAEPEAIRGISAGAFLIRTEIEAFLFNGWIKLYPIATPLPTKMFTDKAKALEWLEQFKRIN